MNSDHDRESEMPDESSGTGGPIEAPEANLLSNVLETVSLRGAALFVWEPAWPFAQTVPNSSSSAQAVTPGANQMATDHIVLEGPGWGAVAGEEPVRLDTGDILLMPSSDAHVISDRPCQLGQQDRAIAREVGYGLKEAFSRTFKGIVGVRPSCWRNGHGEASGLAAMEG